MSEKLLIGQVLKHAAALARKKAGLLIITTLVATAVLIALQLPRFEVEGGGLLTRALLSLLASSVVFNLISSFLFMSLITELQGERVSWRESLRATVGLIIPLIVLSVVSGLGVGLAMVLFVVPGIMVAVTWAVALPVRVTEDVTVLKALQRSADLTRGQRWPIFWLFVIFFAGFIAIDMSITPLLLGSADAMDVGVDAVATIRFSIGQLIGLISLPVGAVGLSVLYVELRAVETGVRDRSIAQVFA